MQDFGTKADDTAGPSGQLSAAEFNNYITELENSVLRGGLALSGASVNQLATSLFLHAVKSQGFQDSGAANAYVATPTSGANGVLLPADYAALNGAELLFKAAATNTGASTLNIGQTTGTLLGAKAILDQSGTALVSGAIVSGSYVQVRYDASLSAGAGAWVLLPWSSLGMFSPVSAIQSFARNTAPDGWLKANGAAVSRTTYAALFAAIGTVFGVGDGSTTFNLPDLRGEFVRGWDDGRGIDTARVFGSTQTDLTKAHTHDIDYKISAGDLTQDTGTGAITAVTGGLGRNTVTPADHRTITDGAKTTAGTETRPRNIALLYCIKY